MYPQVTQLQARHAELRAELELVRELRALERERPRRRFRLHLRPARRAAGCSA